jgi:hypothetical protein
MERLDLPASRNEDWRPTIELIYAGGDLPPINHIRMQWRLYEGAPGDPLFDIEAVAFEDVAASADEIASGAAQAGDRILRLFPGIGVPAMQTLPSGLNQPEPGEADRFVWDAVIFYEDGLNERAIGGFVYVEKGVTLSGD